MPDTSNQSSKRGAPDRVLVATADRNMYDRMHSLQGRSHAGVKRWIEIGGM